MDGVDPLWCWAHIRRYFIRAGDAHPQLHRWRDQWIERIALLYTTHRDLAAAEPGTDTHRQASDAFEQGMRRWWKENAEARDPNIHPDPGEFGLDLDHVRGLFAEYSAKTAQWTAATTAASRGV